MAAKRPASQSTEVVSTEADSGGGTPAADVVESAPAAPDSAPTAVAGEPAGITAPVQPVAPAQQVVYVEAPKPFLAKSNRGFGILIALLSTVVFAVLYAVALVIVELVKGATADFSFVTVPDFYAPVLMFAIGFVVLVLVLNRAGWAAHVIGSIFVALVTFFGGTGIILLLHINQIPSNRVAEAFSTELFSVEIIIAALLGREVALWMGFAIAARGRKVKARNVDARVLYDEEIAAKRAEYEQANARQAGVAPETEAPVVEEQPAP